MSPSPYYILILSIFTFHTHLNGKKRILTNFSFYTIIPSLPKIFSHFFST